MGAGLSFPKSTCCEGVGIEISTLVQGPKSDFELWINGCAVYTGSELFNDLNDLNSTLLGVVPFLQSVLAGTGVSAVPICYIK